VTARDDQRSQAAGPVSRPLQVLPVVGLPDIEPGADLAALIADHVDLVDGDVVAVASKVISKAEGAVEHPLPGERRAQTRARAVRRQAARVVADAPWATIVETIHGYVCANAGVDASNVAGDDVVVLPVDPDASAARLRDHLRTLRGVEVGVVVTDTFGRPWRMGQTDVALGVAGVPALRSEIGERDRYGQLLDVTEAAIADEIAGAADLVRRKGDGIPVVVVRGLAFDPDEAGSGRDLIRPPETDLFRRGRGGLAAALTAEAARFTGPVDPRDLWRVQAAVEAICGSGVRIRAARPRAGRSGTELAVGADVPVIAGLAAGLLLALLTDLGYGAVLVEAADAPIVWAGRSDAGARQPN
jgi:coenzyme F420-0:L-glutamate ligase/coenzyme F420-1:gamma-L-glutamate ligase